MVRGCAIGVLLVVAIGLALGVPPAAADHLCGAVGNRIGCEEFGHTPTPPDDPEPDPWADYNKRWSDWGATGGECGPGRPGFIRYLVWSEGPLTGTRVTPDDFGSTYGSGDVVPAAPPQHDGSPAVFAVDGFVYDSACIADPGPVMELALYRQVPEFEVGHDPSVRGLVGLETWLWYPGDTTIDVFSDAWTDPVTGITFAMEARGYIESYAWDLGDGTEYVTNEPGSNEHLPGTEAVEHIWETANHYTVTATTVWRGEYRSLIPGEGWTDWTLMTGTAASSATWGPVEVIEIRSELRG